MEFNTKESQEYRTGVLLTKKFPSPTKEERKANREIFNSSSGYFGYKLDHEVPIPVCDCIAFIRNRGFYEEGIFRVPGNVDVVRLLKEQYNRIFNDQQAKTFKRVSILNNHSPAPSVNDVASLMKAFLTELEEPLIPKNVTEAMIEIVKLNLLPALKYKMINRMIHNLKSPNRECLGFIVSFLREITAFVKFNQMDAKNLSTCFLLSIFGKGEAQFQLLLVKHAKVLIEDLINGKIKIYMPSKSNVSKNTKYKDVSIPNGGSPVPKPVEDKRMTQLSAKFGISLESNKPKKKSSIEQPKSGFLPKPSPPPKVLRTELACENNEEIDIPAKHQNSRDSSRTPDV